MWTYLGETGHLTLMRGLQRLHNLVFPKIIKKMSMCTKNIHKNKYMEKQPIEFEPVRKAVAKAMTRVQMSDNVHAALREQRIFVWIKQITSQVHMASSIPK